VRTGVRSPDDVTTLMTLYKDGRGEGDFESGVERGIRGILVNPNFLFRVEKEQAARAYRSATSSLRHGSRSSSGAAYRTISFWIWRRRTGSTTALCSNSRSGACSRMSARNH